MATGAAFYFNIFAFNRKNITSDFPQAHARYTFHRDKVVAAGGINAPSDYWGAQKWLQECYTAATRKNARVWSRFILNLPYDLSHDQRVQLVKEYLADVSRGRAQVAWAIHGDTKAPHAHAIFVDRDVDTGELVARLSDAGSAYRLRKMWEDACNRALAWAGSVNRVSRWGKESEHHKELNARARLESTHRHELAQTALSPLPPVATESTLAPEPEQAKVEPELPKEPPVAKQPTFEDVLDAIGQADLDSRNDTEAPQVKNDAAVDLPSTVNHVLKLHAELRQAVTARDARAAADKRINAMLADIARVNKQIDASNASISEAIRLHDTAMATTMRHKKGLGIISKTLRLFNVKTRKMKAYQQAQKNSDSMRKSLEMQSAVLANRMTEQQNLTAQLTKLDAQKASVMALTEYLGTTSEIEEAINMFSRSIVNATKHISQSALHEAYLKNEISDTEYASMLQIIKVDISQGQGY